jgi:replication-associated recombination protein RarA
MRLYERLKPRIMADIIGQPQATGPLSAFLLEPYPNIIMLEGPTGTGKSTCAAVIARELTEPDGFGDHKIIGANLKTEAAEALFGWDSPFRYRCMNGKFHVLRIEELERLPVNVQGYLKEALEDAQRRYRLVVVATSNGTAAIRDKALLHRFQRHVFHAGPAFAKAFNDWLEMLWIAETGKWPPPDGFEAWGYDDDTEFSGRLALDRMERALVERKGMVKA